MAILGYLMPTVITAIVVGITYIFMKQYLVKRYWEKQGVKYFGGSLISAITGAITKRAFWYDVQKMYEAGAKTGEPYLGYCEVLTEGLLLRDAQIIRNIMIKDFDHFVDRRNFMPKDDLHLHKMLFFMEGEEWKQTRAKLSPSFTTGKIKRLFPLFQSSAKKLVQHVHDSVDSETGK